MSREGVSKSYYLIWSKMNWFWRFLALVEGGKSEILSKFSWKLLLLLYLVLLFIILVFLVIEEDWCRCILLLLFYYYIVWAFRRMVEVFIRLVVLERSKLLWILISLIDELLTKEDFFFCLICYYYFWCFFGGIWHWIWWNCL